MRGPLVLVLLLAGCSKKANPESVRPASTPEAPKDAAPPEREKRPEDFVHTDPFARDFVPKGTSPVSSGQPLPEAAAPTGPIPNDAEVTLRRTGCDLGTCAVYTVVIRADGSVDYNGELRVATKGAKSKRVPAATTRAVIERFRKEKFWSWNAKYTSDRPEQIASQLRVRWAGEKEVRETGACDKGTTAPPALCSLENAIDSLAGTKALIECKNKRGARVVCPE